MKINLKRIGAWVLCFMLLFSYIPVSAEDSALETRDYSAGYSLDSSVWATGDTIEEGKGIVPNTSRSFPYGFTTVWNIPVYFFTQNAGSVSDESSFVTVSSKTYSSGSSVTATQTINSKTFEDTLKNNLNGEFVSARVAESLLEAKESTEYLSIEFSLKSSRGWDSSNSYSVKYNGRPLSNYGNYAVYIEYKLNNATAKFDLNGGKTADGSDSIPEQTATSETEYAVTMPDEPKRDGYAFLGWSSDGGTTLIAEKTTITLNADTTFTAQWEKVQQFIKLDKNTLTMTVGDQSEIIAELIGAAVGDTEGYLLRWDVTIEDSDVIEIEVDKNDEYKCFVTANNPVTATVTVTYKTAEEEESASCIVKVVAGATLYIEPTDVTLLTSNTSGVTIEAFYSGQTDSTVYEWSSSDTSIVEVSGNGNEATITPKAAGEATVTVTVDGLMQQCNVTVVSSTTSNTCYFYLLKPTETWNSTTDYTKKWYYAGDGTVNDVKPDSRGANFSTNDLKVISYPDVNNKLPAVTVNSVTYYYVGSDYYKNEVASGKSIPYFTVRWVERVTSYGYNIDDKPYKPGELTYHINGVIELHGDDVVNISYKVKEPGSTKFLDVFVEGIGNANGTSYPMVTEINGKHTVEQPPDGKKTIVFEGDTYLFDGWYTDEACTKKVSPDTVLTLTSDITFYGKYIRQIETGSIQLVKNVVDSTFISGSTNFTFTVAAGADVNESDFNKWLTANGTTNSSGSVTITVAGKVTGDKKNSIMLNDLPVGTYTITETDPDTATKKYDTTYTIANGASATGRVATVEVTKNNQSTVTFTNTLSTVDFTVNKNVSGNMADRSKSFSFTATVTYNGSPYKIETSGSNYTIANDSPYTVTFSLAHGGRVVLKGVPVGATVVVTETDYSPYTPKYYENGAFKDTNNGSVTVTVVGTESGVTFQNEYSATIDTGITLDVLPYMLLLGGALAMLAVLLVRRRRES